jgi:hypothetical protein
MNALPVFAQPNSAVSDSVSASGKTSSSASAQGNAPSDFDDLIRNALDSQNGKSKTQSGPSGSSSTDSTTNAATDANANDFWASTGTDNSSTAADTAAAPTAASLQTALSSQILLAIATTVVNPAATTPTPAPANPDATATDSNISDSSSAAVSTGASTSTTTGSSTSDSAASRLIGAMPTLLPDTVSTPAPIPAGQDDGGDNKNNNDTASSSDTFPSLSPDNANLEQTSANASSLQTSASATAIATTAIVAATISTLTASQTRTQNAAANPASENDEASPSSQDTSSASQTEKNTTVSSDNGTKIPIVTSGIKDASQKKSDNKSTPSSNQQSQVTHSEANTITSSDVKNFSTTSSTTDKTTAGTDRATVDSMQSLRDLWPDTVSHALTFGESAANTVSQTTGNSGGNNNSSATTERISLGNESFASIIEKTINTSTAVNPRRVEIELQTPPGSTVTLSLTRANGELRAQFTASNAESLRWLNSEIPTLQNTSFGLTVQWSPPQLSSQQDDSALGRERQEPQRRDGERRKNQTGTDALTSGESLFEAVTATKG